MSLNLLLARLSILMLLCLSFRRFPSLLSLPWLMLHVVGVMTRLGVLWTILLMRCRVVLLMLGLAFVVLLYGCNAMRTWLFVLGRRTGHGDARPPSVA